MAALIGFRAVDFLAQNLSVGATFAGLAAYDTTLGVPECALTFISCDSGPSLLLGKDNMVGGAEPNQPNTIHNSCADGTAGIFHVDESIDRLMVGNDERRYFNQRRNCEGERHHLGR